MADQRRTVFRFNFVQRLLALALVVCLPMAPSMVHASGLQTPAPERIVTASDAVLAPFVSGSIDARARTEAGLQQLAARHDPLILFVNAFKLLVASGRGDQEALGQAERILDFMIGGFQPAERSAQGIRWLYGFDYEHGIKAPWWSGMDALFGPMTLYAAWELTGKEAYRDVALKSARLALRPPTEGGVVWRDADECWISEYSWAGIQPSQEFYVLNGHLWGLQSLLMLADATGNREFRAAYECARRGTLRRLDSYRNRARNWPWYQLNPEVIDTSAYVLVELTQFRALHALTGDARFLRAWKQRSRMMRKAYAITIRRSRDGSLAAVFPRIGPPHPYVSLTSPVLQCTVEGREQVFRAAEKDPPSSLRERVAIELPVAAVPSECRVGFQSTVDNPIFQQHRFQIVEEGARRISVVGPMQVALDAVAKTGQTVHVSPRFAAVPGARTYENDEARMVFSLGRRVGPFDYIVISLTPTGGDKLSAILQDDSGRSRMRYLPPLKPGERNLIVLNRLGFPGQDGLGASIRSVSLSLFTNPQDPDFNVDVHGVFVARNIVDLMSVIEREEPVFMPVD